MKPIRYRENVVNNMVEVLASQMRTNDPESRLQGTNNPTNTPGGDDMYAEKDLKDPGFPGWVTGTGPGPEIGGVKTSAYQPTSPVRLSPEAHPLYSGFPYSVGSWLADQAAYGKPRLTSVGNWLSDIGRRPGAAALKGALGFGVLGAGAGMAMGRDALMSGGIGSAIGGLGSLGAGLLTKASSSLYSNIDFLARELHVDFSINSDAKNLMLDAIRRLKPNEANALADVVRSSAGASVGALVARYLFGLGLVGTAIFALLGAGAGFSFGSGSRNALGETVDRRRDPFRGAF